MCGFQSVVVENTFLLNGTHEKTLAVCMSRSNPVYQRLQAKTQTPLPLITEVSEGEMMSFLNTACRVTWAFLEDPCSKLFSLYSTLMILIKAKKKHTSQLGTLTGTGSSQNCPQSLSNTLPT